MKETTMNAQPSHPRPDINVTPLIDVLLVLLIIFMVITPLKPAQLESKIPDKPSPDMPPAIPFVSIITLSVDSVGRISAIKLNDELIQPDQLEAALHAQLEAQPPDRRTVFIQAPRQTIYGDVVGIIDQVKSAGGSPIGLHLDDLPES